MPAAIRQDLIRNGNSERVDACASAMELARAEAVRAHARARLLKASDDAFVAHIATSWVELAVALD